MSAEVPSAEVCESQRSAVDRYLDRIGRIALLDAEGEVELAKDIEVGIYAQELLEREEFDSSQAFHDLEALRQRGVDAKKELVEANLRLVIPIAHRYRGRGVPLMDLIQEGSLGLLDAALKFDHAKGFKFITFATYKVNERIIRSFFTQGYGEPVGGKRGEKLSKLGNVERRLQEGLGRTPTKQELAIEMKMSVEDVTELIVVGGMKKSLDMEIGIEGVSLGSVIEDTDDSGDPLNRLIVMSMQDEVGDVLVRLGSQKEAIIRGRFGFEEGKIVPHVALGKKLKMKYTDVKAMETEILEDLRRSEDGEMLREYYYS